MYRVDNYQIFWKLFSCWIAQSADPLWADFEATSWLSATSCDLDPAWSRAKPSAHCSCPYHQQQPALMSVSSGNLKDNWKEPSAHCSCPCHWNDVNKIEASVCYIEKKREGGGWHGSILTLTFGVNNADLVLKIILFTLYSINYVGLHFDSLHCLIFTIKIVSGHNFITWGPNYN